jgi:hypothetical protein
LWQGVLEDKNDIARVQLPIPRAWLETASKPHLHIFLAGDVPANAAASEIWASRNLSMKLLRSVEGPALRAKNLTTNEYYPLVSRNYSLQRKKDQITGDLCMLEISYEDAADYLPSMSFASQQRVAFAAELYDAEDPSKSSERSTGHTIYEDDDSSLCAAYCLTDAHFASILKRSQIIFSYGNGSAQRVPI